MQLPFPFSYQNIYGLYLKEPSHVQNWGQILLKYSKTLQLRSLINDYNYILEFTRPEELL